MALLAFGINHKTAPINIREQAAFTRGTLPVALQDLLSAPAVNEAMILSTCNRTEVYSDTNDPGYLIEWLASHRKLADNNLHAYLYQHENRQAVNHIMRVACGLDSMMLGEAEIFGQMKDAYSLALDAGGIGRHLGRLFQNVFSVTKHIRTSTRLGANPVSIAYASANLAKRIFTDISQCCVLLIGAGDTIELTTMHLQNLGVKDIIVANRSIDKAEQLAKRYFGHWISLNDVAIYLQKADIVISATDSQTPILGKGTVEQAIKLRKHRPIFMVDLAVPRDIEEQVAKLSDVFLYNIDDLQNIIADNLKSRRNAADHAETIIELQTDHFMRELQILNSADIIKDYRDHITELSDHALQQAQEQLAKGKDPEAVINTLTHNLTNKLMHQPTLTLRQAAYDGRIDILALARKLLGI